MAAPALAAAAKKAAVAVATNKKLRNVVGGIVLGVIIIIVAPIAILLSVFNIGQSFDWNSPEMQQQIIDNLTDEQRERLQRFEDTLTAIEDEITAQELSVEPIKAQVIFLCTLIDREETDTLYAEFVSCFADDDDESVFANLADKFDVSLTAEEKEKILLLCEKAVESQTVLPTALHDEIGAMLADDTTPLSAEPFVSPFKELDWKTGVTSKYGTRNDPFTVELQSHSGIDLAAATGTPIYPIKPGKVLFVRYDEDGYGHYLVVSHGDKQASLYAHCSEILVTAGDEVGADTVIAKAGNTSNIRSDAQKGLPQLICGVPFLLR